MDKSNFEKFIEDSDDDKAEIHGWQLLMPED